MTIALYSSCLCIPNNRSQFNKSSIYIQTETTECDNSQIKTNKTVKKVNNKNANLNRIEIATRREKETALCLKQSVNSSDFDFISRTKQEFGVSGILNIYCL